MCSGAVNGWLQLAAVILLACFVSACGTDSLPAVNQLSPADTHLADSQDISMTVRTATQVHAGEPFEYRVRVLYRADKLVPDFTGLLRNVRFVPFEQLHLSRPTISNTVLTDGTNEYLLSYPILGISVVPHTLYTLDPVRLSWRVSATGETGEAVIQPEPVQLVGYYPPEIVGQSFQSLRSAINDHYLFKQSALAVIALLLLIAGGLLVYGATRRRALTVSVRADWLRQQYESIPSGLPGNRQSLLSYEKLLLTLLLYYRKYTAHEFWTRDPHTGDLRWKQSLQKLKQGFSSAYQQDLPDTSSVNSVRDTLQYVFADIENDIQLERQAGIDDLQGTLLRRIRQHRLAFTVGSITIVCGLIFVMLLVRPAIWRDSDTVMFNNWANSLPQKMFDSSRDNELGIIDVQMLVQFSEQQQILQQLQSEYFKSAYLYNFGTIVAKAYVAILSAVDEQEEEIGENETSNKPSFEFPLQLLANAVRFYPHAEDGQRNLELVIMLREREKKDEENSNVQGEVGPPLPGFSRDMKQLLF